MYMSRSEQKSRSWILRRLKTGMIVLVKASSNLTDWSELVFLWNRRQPARTKDAEYRTWGALRHWECYQETTGEDKAGWADSLHAVAICKLCTSIKLLKLIVVKIWESNKSDYEPKHCLKSVNHVIICSSRV
jgi:hypothetical protein